MDTFPDHVDLLNTFLDRRQHIAAVIESRLLNVREKDLARSRDRGRFDRLLSSCFFDLPGLTQQQSQLKGQLTATRAADGLAPVPLGQVPHELDPLELIVRAYQLWDSQRWPGASGRLAYARVVYAVFVLRQLEHLILRIWDDGNDRAAGRLRDVQRLLDRLNEGAGATVLVRDARWLMQTAQGPLTRLLEPYFRIADHIAGSFSDEARLEIHRAGATLAGGHLRSQLRYRADERNLSIDDPEVLAVTRNSNAMDGGLLVRDLVPLLEAYARALGDADTRRDLADAILQGLSADPELLITRLDLLGPCTFIEDLFVEGGDDGRARLTKMGEQQMRILERYGELAGRLAAPLIEDATAFDPSLHAYSPYGIAYGFCADLLSNTAFGTLIPRAQGLEPRASGLEDVFTTRGHLDYSPDWAAQAFARLITALRARATHGARPNASARPDAKLFVVPAGARPVAAWPAGLASAQDHFLMSDRPRALASGATGVPNAPLLSDRQEGRFLASVEIDGKWFAISKVALTLFTSLGRDAIMTDVPDELLDALRLSCPGLLVIKE